MFGKTLTGLMGKKILGLKLALIGGTGELLLAASARPGKQCKGWSRTEPGRADRSTGRGLYFAASVSGASSNLLCATHGDLPIGADVLPIPGLSPGISFLGRSQ